MLKPLAQHGVSLIEVMVTVVIAALLMAVAAPSFSNWIAGSRIRATAEGLLAGLQYARSEATTRNTQVRFQLTTSLGNDCKWSTSAANWVVDVVDADTQHDPVEDQCDATPDGVTPPSILQVRSASETGNGTVVSADSEQVIFNGLGRQVAISNTRPVATVTIDISSNRGQCAAAGGNITCLRLVVSPAGQVRMCNPRIAVGDPQAC